MIISLRNFVASSDFVTGEHFNELGNSRLFSQSNDPAEAIQHPSVFATYIHDKLLLSKSLFPYQHRIIVYGF
jgi:hypothetical protein